MYGAFNANTFRGNVLKYSGTLACRWNTNDTYRESRQASLKIRFIPFKNWMKSNDFQFILISCLAVQKNIYVSVCVLNYWRK